MSELTLTEISAMEWPFRLWQIRTECGATCRVYWHSHFSAALCAPTSNLLFIAATHNVHAIREEGDGVYVVSTINSNRCIFHFLGNAVVVVPRRRNALDRILGRCQCPTSLSSPKSLPSPDSCMVAKKAFLVGMRAIQRITFLLFAFYLSYPLCTS